MVRNTAKAIIEYDNKVLFIKKKVENIGVYYTLPGGGQESGETMEDTILRECTEELNISTAIKKIICVREYISNNHEYSFLIKQVHAIEFIFLCSFGTEEKLIHLQNDVAQIGFEWIDISMIIEALQQNKEKNGLKFPQTLRDFLFEYYIARSIKPYSIFKFEL
ncbi:NUDIX domain-containing protein [Paenibacillus sp. OV219]|uniref:NUDIX domain-containing protein n=1 Tax=Paenibacillus sp. OV219 TaxID=1884377 RepID=UPI0008C1D553|nr:NUDIX domain-containing protein [Paenibacillus sp. OV219]SEO03740.1 ADP-ribose pyrophosphatase YjhB, NUDIX family [Paenibacillus sp. OV219]